MVEDISEKIQSIVKEVEEKIKMAFSVKELEDLRVAYTGKKGDLTLVMSTLATVSVEERPQIGKLINDAKDLIEGRLNEKLADLKQLELEKKLQEEKIDITLPGTVVKSGKKHPLRQVLDEIVEIFVSMGFSVAKGPDVETEYNNFTALNILPNHPARDMHATFYVTDNLLLRTHTSPVQIRLMKSQQPPVAMIMPGKVYRCDSDASHSPMFHQVEGLLVDKKVTFGNLKSVLDMFVQRMFGSTIKTRFRPSYFPFTEPSAEVDIHCIICGGKGCRVCKQSGWLEVLGCGMVHTAVFENVDYDSAKYTGFAFGMGVERITMLKFGINDIRLFFENDIRFLSQF